MSEQEVTSASPISGTAVTNSESANAAETPKAPQRPTKQQLIAQRKLRKQIEAQQKHLRAAPTRAELYGFLQQIDSGMTKMDSHVSLHQNVIAFLVHKGIIDQKEFEAWDAERKEQIKAAQKAAKEKEANGNSDGEVQPDLQQPQAEAE
jgi:hypothetical protein